MNDFVLINLNNIVKKYQLGEVNTTVLDKINLQIKEHELLAIVGASGSGKTTLMNIIGLLDTPTEGEYFLAQQKISHSDDNRLAYYRNEYIGFVFQQFNLLPRFTVEKNVALPLSYRNLTKEEIKEKVNKVLELVGMHNYLHHRPNQLSGGQQQRVAIARALVGDPKIILADEPTGSLDSKTGQEIMDLFLKLNASGRTLIIVTHDEHIAKLCKRQITLVDGKIVGN